MNEKEKNAIKLQLLTLDVDSKYVDRRSFIKGAVALGLGVSSAMLLYREFDPGPNGAPTGLTRVFAEEKGRLITRLPELSTMPLDMYTAAVPIEGKTFMHVP